MRNGKVLAVESNRIECSVPDLIKLLGEGCDDREELEIDTPAARNVQRLERVQWSERTSNGHSVVYQSQQTAKQRGGTTNKQCNGDAQ